MTTTPDAPRPYGGDYDLLILADPDARAIYLTGLEDGDRMGYARALATLTPCEHTHPAIATSVAAMFPQWDGAEAAHRRSVAQFHAEHRQGVDA
ncbi:hypothetical protein [Citricoccus sp.]|uniref:hypothetical protein n=1 Tax=Citricoccus sp. TaxID=1978372 RepID=UPI0026267D13|nr:hypothetical protein [Citricoccus sp.]HRO31292.1 hypothetical protein [Citricoccus sp.]